MKHSNISSADTFDLCQSGFEKSLYLSMMMHQGMLRPNGEPCLLHSIRVAERLKTFDNSERLVQAALLHDVCEQDDMEMEEVKFVLEEIKTHIGSRVAVMVHALGWHPDSPEFADYFQKLSDVSEEFPEVLLVKICDQLDDLTTLDALSPRRRAQFLENLREHYLPIYRSNVGLIEGFDALLEELEAAV
jgi:guanosine-3',5'-bis(diphosphate) 3'-pyrophosphohydrolase